MKRILFSATTSNTGKTTICSGVQRAFRNRGLKVQPYKIGPDYIDTEYHFVASGNKSRNLDEFMLPVEEIKYLFSRQSENADVSIIEGVMGLYDGLGDRHDYCSSASMAKILDSPVVLIIDGKSMAASAAALVLGYKNMDPCVNIAGVIANNVSTQSHFDIIKSSVEKITGIKVLGRIPKDENFALSSRHLGLTPSIEIDGLDERLDYIASVIEKHIDLDELMALANSKPVEYDKNRREKIKNITDVRLGIAYDKAFNFYYADALDLLEDMGVDMVKFSPLKDKTLPDNIDGLFLGGGFPEMFAEKLAQNKSLLKDIKSKAENNMPIYAECGGLMYLGEQLESVENDFFEMTKILKGKSIMSKRLQRFGYCEGIAEEDTVISNAGDVVKGHEFHYSDFFSEENSVYEMKKNMVDKTVKKWRGGYKNFNSLGTYLHTHFAGNYNMAINFIKKMEQYKKENRK